MSEQAEIPSQASKPAPLNVHVFGGGIAGLTAAHELALRGFEVHLYEKESCQSTLGPLGEVAVGGMARTQYFFVTPGKTHYYNQSEAQLALEELASQPSPSSPETLQQPSFWLRFISGRCNELKLTRKSRRLLKNSIKTMNESHHRLKSFGENLKIYVQAFMEDTKGLGKGIIPTLARQQQDIIVKKLLAELVPPLKDRVLPYPEEGQLPQASKSFGMPAVGRSWVRVLIYCPMLPGEHGYRLFPSYYRHVFDTMGRTPLYNEMGRPVGGTVLDNLRSLPSIGVLGEEHRPFIIDWKPLESGQWLARSMDGLKGLKALGSTLQDQTQFSLRVLRFMLTCPERRAAELKDISWWEYLQGSNPHTGTRLYRYSKSFEALVKSSGRVLVALDAEWAEAHTCGTTYAQLISQALVPTPRTYSTLTAPTSEAWLFHWHKHLERLGVKFHHAELAGLELEGASRLVARGKDLDSGESFCIGNDDKPCYFVLATDLVSARQVTKGLPGVGVLSKLKEFADTAPPRPRSHEEPVCRDPEEETGRFPWDRLQTLSGVQFFSKHQLNIFDGYTFCTGAPWGLSAISSQVAWEDDPTLSLNNYMSLLSVDVGDWKKCSPEAAGKSAWDSTPTELANEVWRQYLRSLRGHKPDQPPIHMTPPGGRLDPY